MSLLLACTGGTELPGDPGCDAAQGFLQYEADPANSAYDDPYVEAACDGDELRVRSNDVPHFEFVQLTPNPLVEQDDEWTIPLEPELAASTTEIPLLGLVAFTLTGLHVYGPNEGDFPDPYGDPVYNDIVDGCGGHTAFAYHAHALVTACIDETAPADGSEPDPLLGYALDGFPILGRHGCADADCGEVVEYRSGWVQTGDPTTWAWDNHRYEASDDPAVLDACNGHVGPGGDYHYHETAGFPYVLGCYAGSPSDEASGTP